MVSKPQLTSGLKILDHTNLHPTSGASGREYLRDKIPFVQPLLLDPSPNFRALRLKARSKAPASMSLR